MSKASQRANVERQNAARDVVLRARAGDQVAMGILAMVRDNARKRDPKAQQSLRAIERYISKNPNNSIGSEKALSGSTNPLAPLANKAIWLNPTPEVIITAVPRLKFWQGVVALVHGPKLDNQRLESIQTAVTEDDRTDFKAGVLFWKNPRPEQAETGWLLGRVIGLARCIQQLQIPTVPIATFCPATAWELGE